MYFDVKYTFVEKRLTNPFPGLTVFSTLSDVDRVTTAQTQQQMCLFFSICEQWDP